MRRPVDVHHLSWQQAWDITSRSISFTDHTLMPEALLARLLPRHLEIIYEINRRFLEQVRLRFPGDEARAIPSWQGSAPFGGERSCVVLSDPAPLATRPANDTTRPTPSSNAKACATLSGSAPIALELG